MTETQTLSLTDFLLARIAEDEARDERALIFRRYRLNIDRDRRDAVLIARSWLSKPGSSAAGEDWLRRIARHWRRHPDYREEWRP